MAAAYAQLRRRGRAEVRRLEADYSKLSSIQREGYEGQRIRQHINRIETASQGTYLSERYRGEAINPETAYMAKTSANQLQTLVGEKGRRGRAEEQERRNRIFREQIRLEEMGVPSAQFGGVAGALHFERVFYMATESMWSGLANKDRDKAIMEALGTNDLETAYEMVMEANPEALAMMREYYGGSMTEWQGSDSDPILAYIVNMIAMSLDR